MGLDPFCEACAGRRRISPLRLGLSAPGSSDRLVANGARSPFAKRVQDGGTFPLSDWDFLPPARLTGSSDDNAVWVGMRRTRVGRQVQEEGMRW